MTDWFARPELAPRVALPIVPNKSFVYAVRFILTIQEVP